MDRMRRIVAAFIFSAVAMVAQAQETAGGTEDFMRSNGKIYVVVAVVVTIVAGLFLYLLNLDRKISRMEKNRTSGEL